jgi:hypothetical protein
MQYTPPQSPDPHHPRPESSFHPQAFKFPPSTSTSTSSSIPMDTHHSPLAHDTTTIFAKRPISPPLSSGEISSDSHRHLPHHQAQPVSLLSALMHSPPSTGMLSPHSSAPSTAVSSPHLRPMTAQSNGNGGLEVPAMSILRRDSVSSEGEALAGLSGPDGGKAQRPQVQPQQQTDGCEVCPGPSLTSRFRRRRL